MFNKKTAFTLAEVLLVLAIIGVIAAVTIPGIMQQSSEKKFAALAKKTVSTLQNAINLKLATVPVGPGDLGMGLLEWLLDGEEDGTNTLKSVQTNADSSAVQFPDGVLVFYGSGRCTTQTTKTNLLGCSGWLRFDLNGAEPPTRTRLNNASAMLSSQMSNATGYDQIYLNVNNDGRIRIYSNNPGIQEDIRAKKYLGL
ncbi:prepilin-type N-terminal cleavage/methylation domain-containing protein [bacterium]|nr:prepilin-type N-terminal cleavage/methylation domain-containing protein [bacterium]